MSSSPRTPLRTLPEVLLLAACALVFARSLETPFFFDDHNAVTENPHVRSLWPLHQAMSARPDTAVSGRPIVSLTLSVNHAISGLDPWSYHAFNLAVHAANAWLVFTLLRRVLRRFVRRDHGPRNGAEWLAFAVALLWAIHPLNSEAVVYVTQRTELLFAFFLLGTLACFTRGSDVLAVRRTVATGWFAASVAACALGMATKEVMVVAPLLVLLYDRAVLSGTFLASLRRHGLVYLGLAATWAVLAAIVSTNVRAGSAGFNETISPWTYLLTQAGVVVHYLRLCFWPHPLSVIYHWPFAASAWEVWPQGLVVLALLGVTAWALWRNSLLGLAGAWFFVILGPTSSVVPILTEVAAERRMYLPSLAVLATVVVATYLVLQSRVAAPKRRFVESGALAALALAIGGATMLRVEDYQTEQSIWESAEKAQPDHPVKLNEEALRLAVEGKPDEALAKLDLALRIDPFGAEMLVNRGVIRANLGQTEAAEADLRRALRYSPDLAHAKVSLAALLAGGGRTDEAVRLLNSVLLRQPDHAEALALRDRLVPPPAPAQ